MERPAGEGIKKAEVDEEVKQIVVEPTKEMSEDNQSQKYDDAPSNQEIKFESKAQDGKDQQVYLANRSKNAVINVESL